MTDARVRRGRESQEWLAERLRSEGWPNATSRAASLPGIDVFGCPGLAPEVKATGTADTTGALRQAQKNALPGELPFVVYRPKGYGKERMDDWVVSFRLEDAIALLKKAGYGNAR